jgi:hypothetical protein
MPWADSVPAIVHAWYLGNATGDAIADVLFGKVNPSGKLPITFPARLEDVPSFGHFNVDNGKVLLRLPRASCEHSMLIFVVQVRYAEDIYVVSAILLNGSASIFATYSHLAGIQTLSTQTYHPRICLRVRKIPGPFFKTLGGFFFSCFNTPLQTRLVVHNFPVFVSRSVRTKAKRE